jgi:ABC-type nitrate/sulfonate/bicarbonate transport system ATPase subunit
MSGGKKVKVQVTNLVKRFGDLLVIDDLSFNIYDGEFLVIVGPTGCGKTTFLNLFATLIPPSEGQIKIDGEPVDLKRHNLAYIFQEPSCIPWLTVDENIRFGFDTGRRKQLLKERKAQERIKELTKLAGLEGYEANYPKNLSVSLQQLVVIARGFAIDPDLLLMDEPYGQLDIKTRLSLESELLKVWSTLNKTVMFVTHNIEEAVYLAERIIVLTNKPTKIKQELNVNIPHPRDVTNPEFVKIREEVTDLIKWW